MKMKSMLKEYNIPDKIKKGDVITTGKGNRLEILNIYIENANSLHPFVEVVYKYKTVDNKTGTDIVHFDNFIKNIRESKINLKDLIKEERSETFDLFLKKDLMQMPRYYAAKIVGGSLNKLQDALIAWDAQYRKTNKYKDGDIEKFARKFIGDARIDKAKRWFEND